MCTARRGRAARAKSALTEHRGGRAAGRRAALQPGQRIEDRRRGQHLLDGDRVAEQRVRVVGRVLARLDRDLGERLRAVPYFSAYSAPAPPNICAASGASSLEALRRVGHLVEAVERVRAVVPLWPSAPFSICSKPSASTHSAAPPSMACRARYSARRAGGAVVVHVEHRDAGQPSRTARAARTSCRRRRSRRRPAGPGRSPRPRP